MRSQWKIFRKGCGKGDNYKGWSGIIPQRPSILKGDGCAFVKKERAFSFFSPFSMKN
jgi:hypothetical protein